MVFQRPPYAHHGWPVKIVCFVSILIMAISVLSLVGWMINLPLLSSWGESFIPMAPSTSSIFFVFGALFYVAAFYPQSKIVRFLMIVSSLMGIIGDNRDRH